MRILVMGLPGSGKSTFAKKLVEDIKAVGRRVEWFNADKIRETFNDWDFSDDGRLRQAERMAEFALNAEEMGNIVVADFVCPTHKLRSVFKPDIIVWMDTITSGRYEDTNKIFEAPRHYDYHITELDAMPWTKIIADQFKTQYET
jgi:adenylylsulfate kinase